MKLKPRFPLWNYPARGGGINDRWAANSSEWNRGRHPGQRGKLDSFSIHRLGHAFLPTGLFLLVMIWAIAVTGALGSEMLPQDDTQDDATVMELMNEVARLEAGLQHPSLEDRTAAQTRLIALGPAALDCLSPVNNSMPTDLQNRLRTVRKELEKQAAQRITQPTRVTLQGPRTLTQILQAIEEQTGNRVDVPGLTQEMRETVLECQWEQVEFWELLRELMVRQRLTIDSFANADRVLSLTPILPFEGGGNADIAESRYAPLHTSVGVLSLEVNRIDNSLNLRHPTLSGTRIELACFWEPRLQPIAIDVPYRTLVMVDTQGRELSVSDSDQVGSAMIQPGFNGTEFAIDLPLLSRESKALQSLAGKLHLLVPGRNEVFQFKQVDRLPPGSWIEKGDARVTFEGIEKIEDLYGLKLTLGFNEANNALESHQGWAFQNQVYLETEESRRVEPIGFETYQQTNRAIGIKYLFAELPANANLKYETPAAVIKLELPFRLLSIPLP